METDGALLARACWGEERKRKEHPIESSGTENCIMLQTVASQIYYAHTTGFLCGCPSDFMSFLLESWTFNNIDADVYFYIAGMRNIDFYFRLQISEYLSQYGQ